MPYVLTDIQTLREDRHKLGNELRAILDKAKAEKRSLSGEENARIDTIHADAEELRQTIHRMEVTDDLLSDSHPQKAASQRRSAAVDPQDAPEAGRRVALAARDLQSQISRSARDTDEYRAAFSQFCDHDGPSAMEAIGLARRALVNAPPERRAQQADNPTQAGVLMPPMQWVSQLLADLAYDRSFRRKARTFQIGSARSLGAPKLTTRLSTWAWGSEIATPTDDTSLAFGKRELYPSDASGLCKVSRPWLAGALMAPEDIVRGEMARDGGELMENGFWTGSGQKQPLGVFTASNDGISTGRDVSTGNTTTAMTVAGLREAKYTLKTQYWKTAQIVTSRTGHKQVYAMTDGSGRPLFTESLRVGEPDFVLGMPIDINEFVPNTFTTGLYVAIIGDFSWYWIADALDITLQRLEELYALTNQVGFIGRLKTDGMPVLEEAFVRVKLA